MKFKWQTILLLGPTGAGKTPLGEILEKRGLWGRKCLHFDFGQQLRSSVVRQSTPLNREEIATVRALIKANALLEDEQFHIALKLFQDFLVLHQAARSEIVLLNGLPRHEGQAEMMEVYIQMIGLICLTCPAEIVRARIKTNAGRDRKRRIDDSLQEVERKLRIYENRTMPLIDYYKSRGVNVFTYHVGPATSSVDVRNWLEEQEPVSSV
jgi:adenylate kinase family enzyme